MRSVSIDDLYSIASGYTDQSRHVHPHRAGQEMSVFSRLFNKGPDSEAERESSAEEREGEEKPASDGKASMRPTAPSFQINAPTDEDSSSVAAAPVMQVGAGDKRIARSSRP